MSKEDKKELVPLPVVVNGNKIVFFDDAAAIDAAMSGKEEWK